MWDYGFLLQSLILAFFSSVLHLFVVVVAKLCNHGLIIFIFTRNTNNISGITSNTYRSSPIVTILVLLLFVLSLCGFCYYRILASPLTVSSQVPVRHLLPSTLAVGKATTVFSSDAGSLSTSTFLIHYCFNEESFFFPILPSKRNIDNYWVFLIFFFLSNLYPQSRAFSHSV